jgi:hypothetical protein
LRRNAAALSPCRGKRGKAVVLRIALTLARMPAQTEGETRPCKFSQVFHLMPAGASWFVFNDMFRLNYG